MSDQFIVIIVLLGALGALVLEWSRAAVVFLLAICSLVILGVIGPKEAFSGFSNQVLITIASLYVITSSVEKTLSVDTFIYRFMGNSKNAKTALAKLMLPVTALSGFMNNTPIVSMLVPQVGKWASSHGFSASKFLLPLSFASILGGVLTLIGTSTNLAVSGLLSEYGYESLGFFDFTLIGLPIALIGSLLIIWRADKIIPDRKSMFDGDSAKNREFIFKAEVGSELDGKTIKEAKLRNLPDAYLFAVTREGETITPVMPSTKLHTSDILSFTGQAGAVRHIQRNKGIKAIGEKHVDGITEQGGLTYHEVIIDTASALVGKTLKESNFRSRYGAAVVAIHRAGEHVDAKLGSVKLLPGDTLLVIADEDFSNRWTHRKDFLAVFPLSIPHKSDNKDGKVTLLVLGASLLLALAGVAPLSVALLLAATLIVALGILEVAEAVRAIDFEILLLIGAALGLAAAVSKSGVADQVANLLTNTLGAFGPIGVLAGIVIATLVLTELITNSAAALLMLPIAISATSSLGVDPQIMAVAVAISASASFLSPVGYQTNTMVFGPGGYKFTDYIRLGWLPSATVVLVLLVMVPLLW